MRESHRTSRRRDQNHGQILPNRIGAFLRTRHPAKTAAHVEAETGVPAETVRKWLERGYVPNGEAMLLLIKHYGAEFLAEALPGEADAWIADAARQAQQERLERQLATTQAQLKSLWRDA